MSDSYAVRPRPDETELVGRWIREEGNVVADDTAKRVTTLIRDWLEPVAGANRGWERLLRDPSDGRFWEVIYPQSEMHGGGPPTLRVVSGDDVRAKYGVEV